MKLKMWFFRGALFAVGIITMISLWIIAQVATGGAYAQLPSTSPGGTLNFITDNCLFAYNATSAGSRTWFPMAGCSSVTPPSAASTWTLVTDSGATKADQGNTVVLTDSSSNGHLSALLKSVPTAPYSKTFTFRIVGFDTGLGASCGPVWTNGATTSSSIDWQRTYYNAAGSGVGVNVFRATNFAFAGGASDLDGKTANGVFLNIQFKIQDDNSNRIFFLLDGNGNQLTMFSVVRTSPFTPTHYGIACNVPSTGKYAMTLLGVD